MLSLPFFPSFFKLKKKKTFSSLFSLPKPAKTNLSSLVLSCLLLPESLLSCIPKIDENISHDTNPANHKGMPTCASPIHANYMHVNIKKQPTYIPYHM